MDKEAVKLLDRFAG